MSRKNWLRLFLGVLLLGASAVVLDFWAQRLAPSKAAFAGTWITASQPDGFATAMLLRPNGTCRVRWLDGAGNDTKPGHPPREDRWWLRGETLFVDASVEPSWFDFKTRRENVAQAWPFTIQEESLVFGAVSNTPTTLSRVADALP